MMVLGRTHLFATFLSSLLVAWSLSHMYFVAAAPDPDAERNAPELISSKGYPLETHYVQTKDGYILTVFRIPGPKVDSSVYLRAGDAKDGGAAAAPKRPGPPVILQHGLLDSCVSWVFNYEDQSLAYILADAGYDVWLGNSRGNLWSMNHTNFTNNSVEFWDFSFDEMAWFDTPAFVDHVVAANPHWGGKTGWVGHSQGTLQMHIALSVHGSALSSKISHYAGLAPVGYVNHETSAIVRGLVTLHVDEIFELFDKKSFLPTKSLLHMLGGPLCDRFPTLCEDAVFLITGQNDAQPFHNMNVSRFPVVMHSSPAGTSVKNMVHWAQMARSGKIAKYDFGIFENLFHYHSLHPPEYTISNITNVSVSLYTGGRDTLADPTDVLRLISDLQKFVHDRPLITRVHNEPDYGHLDPTWGLDCKDRIYPMVKEDMDIAFGFGDFSEDNVGKGDDDGGTKRKASTSNVVYV